MGVAKPFENTTISAPRWAPVRVRNRDDGGGGVTNTELSPVSIASARDRSENLRINEWRKLGL